jgi:hypothetical protein
MFACPTPAGVFYATFGPSTLAPLPLSLPCSLPSCFFPSPSSKSPCPCNLHTELLPKTSLLPVPIFLFYFCSGSAFVPVFRGFPTSVDASYSCLSLYLLTFWVVCICCLVKYCYVPAYVGLSLVTLHVTIIIISNN